MTKADPIEPRPPLKCDCATDNLVPVKQITLENNR